MISLSGNNVIGNWVMLLDPTWTEFSQIQLLSLSHKLFRFNHDRGRIQVDLFVMKAIAERRPIAVTISNYERNGTELGREKLGFTAVEEVTAGVPTIAKALMSVGFAPESKAEPYARGVVEYVSDHGEELRKALGKMES